MNIEKYIVIIAIMMPCILSIIAIRFTKFQW